MLVIVSVSLVLVALAIVATAKVTQAMMARLGLDAPTVLLWLGLAEWSNEPPATSRRRRGSARPPRRSPHRRLELRLLSGQRRRYG